MRGLKQGVLLSSFLASFLPSTAVASQTSTLVLPLRTVGIRGVTAEVARDLLAGDLEDSGLAVLQEDWTGPLPDGERACDDIDCARALARREEADLVVYGSLSRLGRKIFVRIHALRIGDANAFFTDQLASDGVEDLDAVMRRIADAVATGRSDASLITLETITREETREPRRRAGSTSAGIRAGFILPTGETYTDHRLTSLRIVFTFEGHGFLVETVPLLGIAWGENAVEWTPFDLFVARVFGTGDVSGYLGAGLGLRSVRLGSDGSHYALPDYGCTSYDCIHYGEVTKTAPSLDIGGGLILFRTYGYRVVADLRYHHVFDDFDDFGGRGAHGFQLSFGTSNRPSR